MSHTTETQATNTEPTKNNIDQKSMGPNSPEWWSSWSEVLKGIGFVLGGCVTLIAVVGWGFSLKAGKLKDAASKAKEAAFEQYKEDARKSVADADAKAAEANKIAAQANERAASLEKEAAAARLETEQIKEKLAATAKLAEPTKLKFERAVRNTDKKELCTTVFLKASKNEALGRLDFVVMIIDGSPQSIIKLWPSLKAGAFQSGDQSFRVSPDGKSAALSYIPMGAMVAGFDVTLSGPAVVRITGNRMQEPYDIRIE